jgi:hypothetical protein
VERVLSTAHAFCFARCHRNFFYAFVLAYVVYLLQQTTWLDLAYYINYSDQT